MAHKNGGNTQLAMQIHKAHADARKRKAEASKRHAEKKHEENRGDHMVRAAENRILLNDKKVEYGTRVYRPSKVLNRLKRAEKLAEVARLTAALND